MKTLMYMVKDTCSSWDEADAEWTLSCTKPESWKDYRTVLIEVVDECKDFNDLFKGGES